MAQHNSGLIAHWIEQERAFINFMLDGGDPRSIFRVEDAFEVTHEPADLQ